jgi:serine/threonine protein kinase
LNIYEDPALAHLSEECRDLLSKMLIRNPEERITAKEAI